MTEHVLEESLMRSILDRCLVHEYCGNLCVLLQLFWLQITRLSNKGTPGVEKSPWVWRSLLSHFVCDFPTVSQSVC